MIEECLVVEFRVTGDDCPLSAATRAVETTVDARPPQFRADGNALLRFSASRSAGGLADALDADADVMYLHASETGDRTNFRCLSKRPCVIQRLVDAGFMAETLQYRDGTETYAGAVVGHDVLQGVLAAAGEAVGVTLERIHPLGSEDDEAVAMRWDLTPGQEEALRTALRMGYFAVPREADASEVAAVLDVSKSAFLERLHRGEAALLAQVLDGG